jgi:hypothetical protein
MGFSSARSSFTAGSSATSDRATPPRLRADSATCSQGLGHSAAVADTGPTRSPDKDLEVTVRPLQVVKVEGPTSDARLAAVQADGLAPAGDVEMGVIAAPAL